VLRLIAARARAAERGPGGSAFGELAGNEAATPVLLGLGATELSMSAPAIPAVKRAVRAVDLGRARELAARAIELPSGAAVRELLEGPTD
jgi:phosphocarrier protein FPr